jgi:hypothetical protein
LGRRMTEPRSNLGSWFRAKSYRRKEQMPRLWKASIPPVVWKYPSRVHGTVPTVNVKKGPKKSQQRVTHDPSPSRLGNQQYLRQYPVPQCLASQRPRPNRAREQTSFGRMERHSIPDLLARPLVTVHRNLRQHEEDSKTNVVTFIKRGQFNFGQPFGLMLQPSAPARSGTSANRVAMPRI